MSLKSRLKQVRDGYVSAQVRRVRLPIFASSPLCRRRVRFSGRVQKVGFRQEVTELALRLELTGFAGIWKTEMCWQNSRVPPTK